MILSDAPEPGFTAQEINMTVRKAALYIFGIALVAGVLGGAVTGRVLRTEAYVQHVTEKERVVKKVSQIETVTYKPVKLIDAPPLKDPKQACKGAPVRIVKMVMNSRGEGDAKVETSWLSVQPVGDAYTVTCSLSGYYADLFREGQVVRLYNGTLDDNL